MALFASGPWRLNRARAWQVAFGAAMSVFDY
jgi:hypothetical protein